ncbi:ABC transporter substrate-binding protein [Flavobacteriaceae bacterium 14752]|uniref:ABC transporter substrate-binding protein n=1 Tax=Mesohalobacter salilacus TaxID=2491711 RepID=UPI000F63E274|nr:ABC transporter substrate-binding protein [Flavobacteriaceae bacterium 14752]
MKVKRLYFYILLGLISIIACDSDKKSDQSHLVFRYNEHSDITSLDPAFAKDQRNIWAVHQLYNTLVGLDDSLNLQPELAKSWNISDDGLTYTFKLREDIYFHKSEIFKNKKHRLNSEDVVYSLKRLTDPNLASPGSWIMKPVKSIKSLDDFTLEIKLKENFPAFLGLLSMKYCSVVPREVQTGEIDFRTNPIGTGPFQFKRWIPQEKLVFRKNHLYFETDSTGQQLPYLEAIAITFLPDKQSEFMQFIQGNLDFMSGLDVSYKDELLQADGQLKAKYKNQIILDKSPYLNTEYVGFYLADSTVDIHHKSLRLAINYGFDRQKMIKYLRNGIGIPAEQGFIPKGLPGFGGVQGFSYQPEKAKKLVQQYIKKTGDRSPEVTVSTNPSYVDLIEFMQAELEAIGVKVNIDVLPASTLRQKRSSGQLEAFRASWIADYPDAQNYLSLFYSKNKSPNGPNYTHFESEIYDSIYEKSLRFSNQKQRLQFYYQLDSLIISKAATIPLFYDEAVRFKQKNVRGLDINAINLLDLKSVYKTQ